MTSADHLSSVQRLVIVVFSLSEIVSIILEPASIFAFWSEPSSAARSSIRFLRVAFIVSMPLPIASAQLDVVLDFLQAGAARSAASAMTIVFMRGTIAQNAKAHLPVGLRV